LYEISIFQADAIKVSVQGVSSDKAKLISSFNKDKKMNLTDLLKLSVDIEIKYMNLRMIKVRRFEICTCIDQQHNKKTGNKIQRVQPVYLPGQQHSRNSPHRQPDTCKIAP